MQRIANVSDFGGGSKSKKQSINKTKGKYRGIAWDGDLSVIGAPIMHLNWRHKSLTRYFDTILYYKF